MNKKIYTFLLVGLTTFLGFADPLFDTAIQKELVIIDAVHDYDLNPQTANYSSEAQLLNGLYEGLFSYDPIILEPLPAIAESFNLSRNKKIWTFTIRKDAKFSNGEQITAKSVQQSWISLLNPELNAPFASLLDCIEGATDYRLGDGDADDVGIRVKNDNTLIVDLVNPTEYFSKILSHHAFAVIPEDKGVYSGPYVLKERNNEAIVFEKNTEYYDAENVAIPSIRIINDDDLDENAYRFNIGEAHWATGGVMVESIYDTESLFISPQFGTEFMFFKAGKEPWDNPLVRNAVLAAMPWDILRANNFVIAETLLWPLDSYPEVSGISEQDIDLAKELLAEAGYITLDNENDEDDENDEDTIIDTGLELVFAIPDLAHTREKAEIIVDALAKIGIKVLIETTPSARYLNSFDGWDADLFTYTWIGDFADPLAFLELFRGGSTLRETEWQDDHFDELLEEAALLTDKDERYEKLAEAEQYLLDSGVILPISHPISFNVVDTNILGGWYPNAMNIHPFKNLYFLAPNTNIDGFI